MAVVDYVPVYSINENRRRPAKSSIPREDALAYEKQGVAKFNNNRTVLIMQRLTAEMHKTAPSLKVDEKVMTDFVCGEPYAIAIMELWARR
jgi:hypothetical protein